MKNLETPYKILKYQMVKISIWLHIKKKSKQPSTN